MPRRTGPAYLTIAIDAFRAAGLDVVYLPGACSTSYFYYAAMRHPRYAAVIVGASHNPADDTGQKILGPGVSPIAQGIGPRGARSHQGTVPRRCLDLALPAGQSSGQRN